MKIRYSLSVTENLELQPGMDVCDIMQIKQN